MKAKFAKDIYYRRFLKAEQSLLQPKLLKKKPRFNKSSVIANNHCFYSLRCRAVYRMFGCSRINLRNYALNNVFFFISKKSFLYYKFFLALVVEW